MDERDIAVDDRVEDRNKQPEEKQDDQQQKNEPAARPRLRPTRNDLSPAHRERLVALNNRMLADAIDLMLQAKQAHWNVKGPSFYGLHQLFDEVSAQASAAVDLLAERVVQLGGVAEGTVRVVADKSDLPEYPLHAARGSEHVEAMCDSLARFCALSRAAIEAAGELGDADTADILTEISRAGDKHLWMLEAHLQR